MAQSLSSSSLTSTSMHMFTHLKTDPNLRFDIQLVGLYYAPVGPRRDDNVIIKYADDTYLIVASDNSDTCTEELRYIQVWADRNNLRLNAAKSREIVSVSYTHLTLPTKRIV